MDAGQWTKQQSIGLDTQQSIGMKVYGLRLSRVGSDFEDDEREEIGGRARAGEKKTAAGLSGIVSNGVFFVVGAA